MDKSTWPIEQQVDWYIVWAEMNGYDFNYHILKPWERDPAFYKSIWTERSDVPAHEGPTHHRTTELWTYAFPLSANEKERLIADLKVIAPLNAQAKVNLTGNAKELWRAGIRDIKVQSADLKALLEKEDVKSDPELVKILNEAIAATDDLSDWLLAQADQKTGPSGIGKENYTWYIQNVHLLPMTWDDEVMLLKSELASAWTALKLEEHRNRALPVMADAGSEEEYSRTGRSVGHQLDGLSKRTGNRYRERLFRTGFKGTSGKLCPQRNTQLLLDYGPPGSKTPIFPFLSLVRIGAYG